MTRKKNPSMSEKIRKRIQEAQEQQEPEFLSLQPKEDLPDPDPDTDKQHFSDFRKAYESRLDQLNEDPLTGQPFEDTAEMDSALESLNRIMAEYSETRHNETSRGLLRRFIRKWVLYGLHGDLARMETALSGMTRVINALNHKIRIFAAAQNRYNTVTAEFGQSIVPVIDEKIRYQMEKTATYLKDRMDIFHEGTDRRQTEIANWLNNATKIFEDCIARVERMDMEMQRGLAMQHRKLEEALRDRPAEPAEGTVDRDSGGDAFDAAGGEYAYYLFEHRGRGSEEAIRTAQQAYLTYFENTPGPVLDVGCGRGEFLEILNDAGIPASGVDSNGDMVAVCRDKGLDVQQADGIRSVETTDENSLGGVFAAQVVEHFTPAQLNRWLNAVHRALKPGGVLVYETINAASPYALVTHFFKDPTHTMPRHPDTYRFLTEMTGFDPVNIILRSPVELPERPAIPDLPGEAIGDDAASSLAEIRSTLESLTAFIYSPCDILVVGRKPETAS